MHYTALIERFVAARYPAAAIAVVGGSTARGRRTATSDIDLLLIGDDPFLGDPSAEAATHTFEGETFEVFAYTWPVFSDWAQRDLDRHRPVIVRMLVDGVPVRDDGRLAGLRRVWTEKLRKGPTTSSEELALRRYIVADLIDDVRDARDPVERHIIAAMLYERSAELMLLSGGRWIATGKWLPRVLRDFDEGRASALSAPLVVGDHLALANAAEAELTRAGGRLSDGFVR